MVEIRLAAAGLADTEASVANSTPGAVKSASHSADFKSLAQAGVHLQLDQSTSPPQSPRSHLQISARRCTCSAVPPFFNLASFMACMQPQTK